MPRHFFSVSLRRFSIQKLMPKTEKAPWFLEIFEKRKGVRTLCRSRAGTSIHALILRAELGRAARPPLSARSPGASALGAGLLTPPNLPQCEPASA